MTLSPKNREKLVSPSSERERRGERKGNTLPNRERNDLLFAPYIKGEDSPRKEKSGAVGEEGREWLCDICCENEVVVDVS